MIKWNDATIREAIERFYRENQRYPTSHDFLSMDYLPSPGTVCGLYGGMAGLREKMGHEILDYTKGPARSDLVRKLDERAKADEKHIYTALVESFGEICVHQEKEYAFRNRVDFYVYHKDGTFGVDTFFPKNRYALMNIFNLKEKKYKNYIGEIFLVSMNPDLTQEILDDYIVRRKTSISPNLKLVSEDTFLSKVSAYEKKTIL